MLGVRAKIGAGGRVIIPFSIRERMHFSVGDEIVLHVKDEGLCITTVEQALHQLQQKVKARNKGRVSLVNELLETRRKEAADE
ncbi:AbrB/MazE/SpoVT family DNA-binding domain-containing protein [Kamptonema cortianum]|jgi:AbrB family looped-hinge helix DNA binding protein|nr:AbrB/MazE/SpoVT family DNA-binding domain-containing protein [Geitlerinema splendidum]MDK3155606.1 AbrB/MazE/SpoVT family DNA-binding domain-containing protein [Kamptonema cortianum]